MRQYELTVALPAKTTPAKKKSTSEKVDRLIATFGGKVGKMEDWGENIKGGVSLHFPLELEAKSANQLSSKLRGEEFERFLLIRKE